MEVIGEDGEILEVEGEESNCPAERTDSPEEGRNKHWSVYWKNKFKTGNHKNLKKWKQQKSVCFSDKENEVKDGETEEREEVPETTKETEVTAETQLEDDKVEKPFKLPVYPV